MASVMLNADREMRRPPFPDTSRTTKKPPSKRKYLNGKSSLDEEQNNNTKKPKLGLDHKDEMLAVYQPWVIQTYGDLAKTKTITLKKYARIVRCLRGEEIVSADNSKFRFWVKAKGFHIGQPIGYEAKPADGIVGRYSVCDSDRGIPPVDEKLFGSAKDPPLYVPNAPFKNSCGDPIYRKVAVVENFFDIIYQVHVELEGRPGKHAGQKRTYRTITETYAFLPREAVTRFLLGCTECQKHPRSPSPVTTTPLAAPTPVTPTLPPLPTPPTPGSTPDRKSPSPSGQDICKPRENIPKLKEEIPEVKEAAPVPSPPPQRSSNPLDVCNLTSPVKTSPPPPKKRHLNHLSENGGCNGTKTPPLKTPPKLWSPVDAGSDNKRDLEDRERKRPMLLDNSRQIDYSLPITTTYLKYMRSLGCSDEDALKFENKQENASTPDSGDTIDDDHYGSLNRNGTNDITDLSSVPSGEDMAGLWAQYHTALGLAKGKATPPTIRDQSSPNADAGSAHDETSSSGNKEDEDDDDDESDDKIDAQTHDPERLKAFNMFVRLFVDENLDRMVPISKQPKEKIQAIIDSCTRQFPEFAERARKRIRTYLKSCRRNKRARDPNSPWDATRPTPAHLTSVQAEQILATACENESHNAKRMRLGLEPVSQPMPVLPGATQPTDTTAPINRGLDFTNNSHIKLENDGIGNTMGFPSTTASVNTSNSIGKALSMNQGDLKTSSTNSMSTTALSGMNTLNGIGIASTVAGTAPTAMYRPNFSQAFQRTGHYPLFPGAAPYTAGGAILNNGPTDLSMKQKPLLSHKLSSAEMAAVRQLITGYRESAAFLLRSADELEQLLLQQQ